MKDMDNKEVVVIDADDRLDENNVENENWVSTNLISVGNTQIQIKGLKSKITTLKTLIGTMEV